MLHSIANLSACCVHEIQFARALLCFAQEVGNSREPLQSPDFFPKLTDPTAVESLWKELLGPDECPVGICWNYMELSK